MTLISQLVAGLQHNSRRLYHFTDSRNLPSIRVHGLLPTRTLKQCGMAVITGGDATSLSIDQHKGLDAHVSLSFCRSHPMAHVAKAEGRIVELRILTICPSVLLRDGVLFSNMIATANEATIAAPDALIPSMNFEAMYKRLDWGTTDGQTRRSAAEKWEALIPSAIEPALIVGL